MDSRFDRMIARQTDSQTDRGERADRETTDRQTERQGPDG